MSVALYDIFYQEKKEIFVSDIKEIYDSLKSWLYKKANNMTKGKDILLIENSFYIANAFAKI